MPETRSAPGRVLVVEDNPQDAYHIQRLLRTSPAFYDSIHAETLTAAMMLADRATDIIVILLDLNLTDPQGLDTLARLGEHVPTLPVIVLTGVEDVQLAQLAVRKGAQDYLVKGEVTPGILDRAIRLAWERKRKDQVRKELTYESLNAMGIATSNKEDPAVQMLRGHLRALTRFFDDLHTYMGKNDAAHHEAIRALEDSYNIDLVLRDMNNILALPSRQRRISDHALDVVVTAAGKVSSVPASEDDARRTLVDYLTKQRVR